MCEAGFFMQKRDGYGHYRWIRTTRLHRLGSARLRQGTGTYRFIPRPGHQHGSDRRTVIAAAEVHWGGLRE